jgi:hypothetical protein
LTPVRLDDDTKFLEPEIPLLSSGFRDAEARFSALGVRAGAAHLLGDLPTALVDRASTVAYVPGDLFGLVHGNLRGLELLALGDDGPRFLELRAQLVGVRVRLVWWKRRPLRAE